MIFTPAGPGRALGAARRPWRVPVDEGDGALMKVAIEPE